MSLEATPGEATSTLGRPGFDGATIALVALIVPTLIALGASDGGYFPSSWGWSALVFAWAGVIALLVRERIEVSRAELVYVGAFTALLAWTALSLLWTSSVTRTAFEVERTLSYLTFAVALVVVGRKTHVQTVLATCLAAITGLAAYGLGTRLLPGSITVFDPIGGNRLSGSLGYWNALAAICAIGCVLAFGLAAKARSAVGRGLGAATLVVLVPTLYFTFSRGGWVALFAGMVMLVAIDTGRLQLITAAFVAAPWPALGLWASYRSKGLTTYDSALGDATSDGHRLLLILPVLALASFGASMLLTLAGRRITVGRRVRRTYGAFLATAVVVALVAAVAGLGGPSQIRHKALDSIHRTTPDVQGDQTQRLFSLSSHGRLDLWAAAIDQARAHPVSGTGAGGFEQWWYVHRRIEGTVRDAHNLYLETAGELGLVGLAILLVLVAVPLASAVQHRRHPLVPVAFAGWVVYLLHAAVDWDWEMPAVTLGGLACAGAILMATRDRGSAVVLGSERFVAVGLLLVASIVAFVAMNGNRALTKAREADARGDTPAVVREARNAARWAPWSSEPLRLQADVALAQGRRELARGLYRRAIAKDSGDWELWVGLALASDGSARRGALTRARALNPLSRLIRDMRARDL